MPLIRNRLDFILSLPAYGDIVEIRLGPTPAYAITSPELVRQVLVPGDRDYARGRVFDKVSQVVGEGLASTSGETHRKQRRLLQPVFRHDRNAAHFAAMRTAAEELIASWQPGQVVAVDQAMNQLAITMVTKSLFASGLGAEAATQIVQSVLTLLDGMMVRTALPTFWEKLPTPGNRRYRAAISAMRQTIDEMICAYRATGTDYGDLLSTLLGIRDDGRSLTDRQIRDQVINFVFAGVENLGAILGWALYEFGRCPGIEHHMHAELDTVLGGRTPHHRDLPALDYLGRVITETLRLRAIWIDMRRTLRPVQLGAVTLPAGAEVVFSPYQLHRDPRWFPNPHQFDPDRWLPERAEQLTKAAMIPFAAGAHKCIAHTFAVRGITAALAVICSRWRLRPVPGHTVQEVASVIVHPSHMPMIIESRPATTVRPRN